MPATSLKQKKFMDAAAHNPAFAKQAGIPQKVAKEFSKTSKSVKFGSGSKTRVDRQTANNPKTNQGKQELFKKGGDTMAKKMNPGMMAIMAKKKGAVKMNEGGKMPMKMKDGKEVPAFLKHGGTTKNMMGGGMAYAKGGSASKRADGVAAKGKTKGKMMAMGGKSC